MSATPTPPLRRWSRAWRWGVILGVSFFGAGMTVDAHESRMTELMGREILFGLIAFGAVPFRRRSPLAVAILVSVCTAFSTFALGPWCLVAASLATHRRWWQIALVAVTSPAASFVTTQDYPERELSTWQVVAFVAVFDAMVLAAGAYIGARRELMASLVARAEQSERAQEARVAQARGAERAAIAREMHDVLAHRMSLVAMHAGALAYRDDLSPAETRATANLIQETAHAALTDLRDVLGVLRSGAILDDSGRPERPQPTLEDLEDLVAELRAGGTEVHLDDRREAGRVPQALSRHAYRIVQECCTNALKHAPGAPVSISLAGAPGGMLLIEAANPLPSGMPLSDRVPTPGAGLGLVGLAERASLSGGSLTHELTRDDRFRVRASLPWPAQEDQS